MESKTECFNSGFWWGKILSSVYDLKEFLSYIKNKGSINSYLKENDLVKVFDNDKSEFISGDEKSIERFASKLHSNFHHIGTTIINSTIVYQFAIIEEIFEESIFLFLYYDHKLLKRVEQINSEFNINESVNLELLINNEATKDIIKLICRKACKYMVSGKIEKTLNRMEKLIGLKYSTDIIIFLKDLQIYRNEIVHGSSINLIDIEYLYKSIEVFQGVLMGLEKKLEEKNIHYDRPFNW
ncbi:hypothetical protein [Cyclobacterium jeungdonense]|uniref:RiboL-PSP-HEPN domain-containing protein n=1 Tax=Cyclobacterium jeungdonense TaxID=708087 RepID=A0ABT8C7C4_9BACT|nr:hypothetical protein [Cyclobacterium jeungdonense]MDN3688669.1 hypothetical protein [Cyclobacterium jeungdonense]